MEENVPGKETGSCKETWSESWKTQEWSSETWNLLSEWEEPVKDFVQGSGKIMFAHLDFW